MRLLVSAPFVSASISPGSSTLYDRRRLNHHLFSVSYVDDKTTKLTQKHNELLSRGVSSNLNPRRRRSFTSLRYNTPCEVACSQVEVEEGMGINDDEACELVNGVELSIGEGFDRIRACLFTAVKNNNGTGILLLSDIYGFEDSSTRDFAYRVACNGYNVLVPDLFQGDPWAKDRPKELFEEWRAKQTTERMLRDITTCTKWMMDEFVAAGLSTLSRKLGIIGFCFGGGRVIDVLAQDQGVCFGVGVSFYGTRIDPFVAASLQVPVLFIAGDNDPLCPVSHLEAIEKRMTAKVSKVLIFQGRGHGFAHRPQSADEDEDAEQAFMALRNWLCDGLSNA